MRVDQLQSSNPWPNVALVSVRSYCVLGPVQSTVSSGRDLDADRIEMAPISTSYSSGLRLDPSGGFMFRHLSVESVQSSRVDYQ